MRLVSFVAPLLCLFYSRGVLASTKGECRNRPGDPGFPSANEWAKLNTTVSGRLVNGLPSAKYCKIVPGGICTDSQWNSGLFRNDNPGSMQSYNWEQDYDSNPPSFCLRNSTTCSQGNVPLYAVKATSAKDVQAAVNFARSHNIRLAIKASGHDFLGRSTAKDSLLIFTHALQSMEFTDNFKNKGSAVTIGSGVHLNTIYQACKARGKIVVGGLAGTVVAAGGYIQGAGHSPLSPLLGLAADNTLELEVVVASGELLTVNEDSHPDLYWAIRGGGAGSWGVIVSATFKTYPSFNLTTAIASFTSNSTAQTGAIGALHAKHIFDLDSLHASQYFYSVQAGAVQASSSANPTPTTTPGAYQFTAITYLPSVTIDDATAALKPFYDDIESLGVSMTANYDSSAVQDSLFIPDDATSDNAYQGSRLIPEEVYRDSPEAIGEMYRELADIGTVGMFNLMVAGGKVSKGYPDDTAVNPQWRTAKTHLIVADQWHETNTLDEIRAIRRRFQDTQLPHIEKLVGKKAAAYSNEADLKESDFRTTFFGSNYRLLSMIKQKYDPRDLFIVGVGVGSERWDEWGLCRV